MRGASPDGPGPGLKLRRLCGHVSAWASLLNRGATMEIDAQITLRTLVEQRDRLLTEIEALRNQVAGLEIAIELISQKTTAATRSSGGKGRVSRTLIQLLGESGDAGLTPKGVVELA